MINENIDEIKIERVKNASGEFLDKIIYLEEDAFEGYGNVDLWIIKALMRFGLVFILKIGDEIISIIEFMKLYDEDSVFLYGISTQKKYRHKGYAKKILAFSEKILKEDKIKKIILTVDPKNDIAIDLYKKFNYKIDKFEKDEYGKGIDRYSMYKNL